MSNALAIAAVTTMLDYLITQGTTQGFDSSSISLESVTTKPPDKAREGGDNTNQINIFLYHTQPNPTWRNQDIPGRTKPGETGRSPLALDLFYLITAYGKNNDDIEGHRLLGMAMRVLHDYGEIRIKDIERALVSPNLEATKREILTISNLKNQVERVRITPQPLSTEEISKLWSTFQAPYRISAAYQASVVLIESSIPVTTPLPVLTVGTANRGVIAQPSLVPPYPTLEDVLFRNGQPSVEFGAPLDTAPDIILNGHHLDGQHIRVLFYHPRLTTPLSAVQVLLHTANTIHLKLLPSNTPSPWLAGFYTVQVVISPTNPVPQNPPPADRTTNAITVPLSAKIEPTTPIQIDRAPVVEPMRDPYGEVTITLRCTPPVLSGQRVSLLVGDRELPWVKPLDDDIAYFETLSFQGDRIPPGNYFLRLRVDGVDSLLIDRSVTPPVFDSRQQVSIP